MKHTVLAAAALLCSLGARAEIVTFEFTGFVNDIRESGAPGGRTRAVAATSLTPAVVSVGATFRGSFSFDTAAPRASASGDFVHYFAVPLAFPAAAVDFGNWRFLANGFAPHATVADGASDFLQLAYQSQQSLPAALTFELRDPSGSAFSSAALPSDLDFDRFYQSSMGVSWRGADGRTVSVSSSLSSIARITAVPEPATYGMLLAGVMVVGAAARVRRSRAA